VNFGANQSYRRLLIHEYRGLLGTVDVTASNISSGAVPTSGSTVTKSAGDLIFAAFMDDSGTTTITAGAGFTQCQSTANDTASEDMIQSSAGAVAATANFATSTDYLAQMVAFRAASGTVTVPAAPAGLSAKAGSGQVSLSWFASSGATSYHIYRSTSRGGEGATPIRTGVKTTTFTDAGLTNGTIYYYQVTAVNGAGASGKSAEVSAKPVASGRSINAGGGATSSFGADALFSGGSKKTTTHAITTTGVANAAPEAVYQSARVGRSFSYTVSSLTPGVPYTVRLHFAEIGSVTAARQRVFNVAANGVRLLSNFDIFAAGGGKGFVAIVRQFTVTADSLGTIELLFTGVVGNALLSGFEIVPA